MLAENDGLNARVAQLKRRGGASGKATGRPAEHVAEEGQHTHSAHGTPRLGRNVRPGLETYFARLTDGKRPKWFRGTFRQIPVAGRAVARM